MIFPEASAQEPKLHHSPKQLTLFLFLFFLSFLQVPGWSLTAAKLFSFFPLSPFNIHALVYPFTPLSLLVFLSASFALSFQFWYNKPMLLVSVYWPLCLLYLIEGAIRHSGLPFPSAPTWTMLLPTLVACCYLIKAKAAYLLDMALFSICGTLLFHNRSMQREERASHGQ